MPQHRTLAAVPRLMVMTVVSLLLLAELCPQKLTPHTDAPYGRPIPYHPCPNLPSQRPATTVLRVITPPLPIDGCPAPSLTDCCRSSSNLCCRSTPVENRRSVVWVRCPLPHSTSPPLLQRLPDLSRMSGGVCGTLMFGNGDHSSSRVQLSIRLMSDSAPSVTVRMHFSTTCCRLSS